MRHALAAALRHLARTRLQAAIAVGGLAAGLACAMLAALVVRSEYDYDRDVAHRERVFAIIGAFSPAGLAPQYGQITTPDFADQLKARSDLIEASTVSYVGSPLISLGTRTAREQVMWVDVNFGDLLPMRSLAGDAGVALAATDSLVLSLSAARRWFGEDAPLGRTLMIDDRAVTVRAIVADVGAKATHIERNFLLSSASSDAPHRRPNPNRKSLGSYMGSGATYLRLRPGADPDALRLLLPELTRGLDVQMAQMKLQLVRVDQLHTHEGLNPGLRQRMQLLGMLGALVFAVAALNFVALQTTRGLSRSREIAVRKIAGATRLALTGQFVGEALAWSMASLLLAFALTELLLPAVDAFLDVDARLDFGGDLAFLCGVAAVAALLGTLAGTVPALALARLQPIGVLRAAPHRRERSGGDRVLVSMQFATLIALAIAAGVAHRQREYAVRESLDFRAEHLAIIVTENRAAFVDEVRRLPGVAAATRVSLPLFGSAGFNGGRAIGVARFRDKEGNEIAISGINVDFDVFAMLGIEPLAGRLPAVGPTPPLIPAGYAVINESALQRLGLGTPAEAVEKLLPLSDNGFSGATDLPAETRVLAVVPDFTFDTIATPRQPAVYTPVTDYSRLLLVRLDARRVGETIAAIDAAWMRASGGEPPVHKFLDEVLEQRYLDILRQSQAFGLCSLLAVVLACIGLYALTASAAQRRTREIALRKALGARTGSILQLLLWQFVRPVVWGTLIAWVAAAWLMQRWLETFAYHADLPLWLFPAAAAIALTIAVVTVMGHAVAVARTRPVAGLRHE